jgi:hypothetical protein
MILLGDSGLDIKASRKKGSTLSHSHPLVTRFLNFELLSLSAGCLRGDEDMKGDGRLPLRILGNNYRPNL